jgi:hypothetical protein
LRGQEEGCKNGEVCFPLFVIAFWFFSCVVGKQHAFSKKDAKLRNSEREKERR